MATPSEALRIALEEAHRTLDGESARVDELRARAATILGATAIAATFLTADRPAHPSYFWWTALLMFAVVVCGAVFVLWPRSGWGFTADLGGVQDHLLAAGSPEDVDAAVRFMVVAAHEHSTKNEKRLQRMYRGLEVALAGTVVLVGALVIDVATR
jgi:hypothetical protein